ncbi:MAG: DDE-type integrase/transposase/recombinase [Pyrinomonadaceae bacterium]|nr:DDE-type integrase/transposase/recombinase [Pyrinomonadaceae bacterium]
MRQIVVGEKVRVNNINYEITNIVDLETCLVKDLETGKLDRIFLKDIVYQDSQSSINNENVKKTNNPQDISLIDNKDWEEAQRRLNFVKPLIENPHRTKKDVEEKANLAKVGIATMYRWLNVYQTVGTLTALLPTKRDGGKGQPRISPECEAIIEKVITENYLNLQKNKISKIYNVIKVKCKNANVLPPHLNTVRNRIDALNEKDKTKSRLGKKATQKFIPTINNFPEGNFPLDVIQIDHTKLDIILVDDIERESIGRPWITLAIDVYSRMVVGFYVSFDAPGDISTGICISNAILPKEKLLSEFEITTPWSVWGLPRKIHADNGKDFRGEMIRRSCEQYGIDLEWRPVANPKYGGHIERLLGTILHEIHTLPGTTFSNPKERREYDSEKKAVFTLREFEKWLVTYIVEVYHQRLHKSIKTSPVKKFEQGIFGVDDSPGIGIPPRIVDEERLKIDFLPFVERTVQRYGIVIDEIYYYHDVLRFHINSVENKESKNKKSFICRRDPRDLSIIYFYDPDLNRYFQIPYRNTSHPPLSIWELRKIKNKLEEQGYKEINEDLIFDAYQRMELMKENAKKTTKQVRRENARKKHHLEIKKKVKNPIGKNKEPNYELALSKNTEDFESSFVKETEYSKTPENNFVFEDFDEYD